MTPLILPLDPTLDLERLRAAAARARGGALLDSGDAPGGWTYLVFEPVWTLEGRDTASLLARGGETLPGGSPFDALRAALAAWSAPRPPGAPPFWGGAVGYLAYDLGWQIERLPERPADDLGLPELWLGFHDVVVAIPSEGPALLCLSQAPDAPACDLGARAVQLLAAWRDLPPAPSEPPLRASEPPRPVTSPARYHDALARILDHIAAGDLYQANLSQRFDVPVSGSTWGWYEELRHRNPAPFAAYLQLGDGALVSVSPERFLRLAGDRVETAPIKGTRPRGATPSADAALAQELMESAKDRAEHLMIVDLERNDLGRVCRAGSVQVPDRFTLEAHPTVWHMVSTVAGTLRAGVDAVDLLAATFPGGSITGAPKIRAMEVLTHLEPTRRGVYTGAIGYFARDGALDLNIAIRTAVVKGAMAHLQVGGGIVADSDSEAEYQETLDKAAAFFRTLGARP